MIRVKMYKRLVLFEIKLICFKMLDVPDYVFSSPTTIAISGTTGSGKTTLLKKILANPVLFKTPPKKIIYCYGTWQEAFNKMPNVEFRQGLDTSHDQHKEHTIMILDDLMDEVVQSKSAEQLFTRGSHHKNITVVFLIQNLYQQGRSARTIMLNTHYFILMKNARDINQIKVLGAQTGLGKTLEEAYKDCMDRSYGYLLIDLSPGNTKELMLRTDIFPGENQIVFLPKNALS